jgi:hypothetical protein
MRVFGIFMLGLGITLLIASGVGIVAAAPKATLGGVGGALACVGLFIVPMIVGGILLIRTAEDRQAAQRRPLVRGDTFDLNRLNWVGWLLLLTTIGVGVGSAGAAVLVFGKPEDVPRWAGRLIAVAMVLFVTGFFFAARWLLGLLGVSIYRK